MNERRWFLACAIVVLAACGDPEPVTPGDDGGTPGTDGGPPVVENPPLAMVDTDDNLGNGGEAPANFGCVGTATAPTAGAPVDFTAHFYDFQTPSNDVAMADVRVFTTNVVAADCSGADCTEYTTDASGDVTITAPVDGWIAYRVASSEDYFTSIGYNRAVPAAGGMVSFPAVARSTVTAITTLFMRSQQPGNGVVSGSISDCDGNTVEGAQLRLFNGDTQIQPGTAREDFFVGYIEGSLPDRAARWTFAHGIFASANVPSSATPTRVELWAVIEEGADPVRVSCEAITAEANAISIISMGPTRNDYPVGHPCAD